MPNQVGRNEPCPCGSGKKYKKCCGLKDAVSITVLLEKDAKELQNQIVDYAVSQFGDELEQDLKGKLDYLIINDKEKELEFYILAHSIWFTFFKPLEDGRTILERFIAEKGNNIRRPKLKEILDSWKNARPITGPLFSVSDERLAIRDAFTNEVNEIKLLEPLEVPEKAFAIAVVVPFGEDQVFFWEPFDYQSPLNGNEEEFLKNEFEGSGLHDPMEFLTKEFIILMNQLPHFSVEYGAESIQWEKDAHKETAQLLEENLAKEGNAYEATIMAFALWNNYCRKNPDQRRKPATNAAAIHYLVLDLNPTLKVTKKDVAANYGISVSTLSNALNEIEETIEDEITEFRSAIYDDLVTSLTASQERER